MNFSDYSIAKRKIDMTFFDNINKIVDWNKLEKIILKYYNKGTSVDGRPAYSGILLFKITLLQHWFKLSDEAVEERINDSIKFTKFLGLSMEDTVPDHSVISRFRTAMSGCNANKKLLGELNRQLMKHKIIIKSGASVDASITQSPYVPDRPITFELANDREEEERSQSSLTQEKEYHQKVELKKSQGVDTEARWLKKGKKSYYGYKKHVVTNDDGMVLNVETTSANESDTKQLKKVLSKVKLPKGTRIKTDKGYSSKENRELLKDLKLKSGIQYKAKKNQQLTTREKEFNKIVSKTRFVVERTFGSIVKWFGGGVSKYKGLKKNDYQHHLEAMAYNLSTLQGISIDY